MGVGLCLTTLWSFFVIWCSGIHLNGPLILGFHLNDPLVIGFHLNGPVVYGVWKGVGDVWGVLEAPTLGPFGFRFSRVSPPTFSSAHTDLEYSENHARDWGPPSRYICVDTWSTDFWQP